MNKEIQNKERVDKVVVEFDTPVSIKGKEVMSVTVRRPKVKDTQSARKYSDIQEERDIFMTSALTGVPIRDIENLDLDLYNDIQMAMGKFRRSPKSLTSEEVS